MYLRALLLISEGIFGSQFSHAQLIKRSLICVFLHSRLSCHILSIGKEILMNWFYDIKSENLLSSLISSQSFNNSFIQIL